MKFGRVFPWRLELVLRSWYVVVTCSWVTQAAAGGRGAARPAPADRGRGRPVRYLGNGVGGVEHRRHHVGHGAHGRGRHGRDEQRRPLRRRRRFRRTRNRRRRRLQSGLLRRFRQSGLLRRFRQSGSVRLSLKRILAIGISECFNGKRFDLENPNSV